MKLFKFFTIGLLACSLSLLTSCSKDDDEKDSGSFTLSGESYALHKGLILNIGSNLDGSQDIDLYLFSEEIERTGLALDGVGEGVYLDLNSGSATELEEGTYTYAVDRAPFTFVDGSSVAIDYNFATDVGQETLANGGTVTISKDGDRYEVEFSLELDNGEMATGSYEGELDML